MSGRDKNRFNSLASYRHGNTPTVRSQIVSHMILVCVEREGIKLLNGCNVYRHACMCATEKTKGIIMSGLITQAPLSHDHSPQPVSKCSAAWHRLMQAASLIAWLAACLWICRSPPELHTHTPTSHAQGLLRTYTAVSAHE